ncbi:MAG: VOC family protein [Chloroflexota bacterium]
MKNGFRPICRAAFEQTYTGADIEANWTAFFATIDLCRVATEVGDHLGYAYPYELDRRATATSRMFTSWTMKRRPFTGRLETINETMMKATRIFETVIYADDLVAARQFYTEVLGLELVTAFDVAISFRCEFGALLIFDPEKSILPGRDVPSHGAIGPGHIAFAAPADTLDDWRAHLAAHDVPIEKEVTWSFGGTSIYFRDPAGNSVELAPSTLWGGDWGF